MLKILPHFCIILSVVMLVFLITDQVNSAMAFINNQGTKVIMIVFSLLVLLMSILYIADQQKKLRKRLCRLFTAPRRCATPLHGGAEPFLTGTPQSGTSCF